MDTDIGIDIFDVMSVVFRTQFLALNLVQFLAQFLSKFLALFQTLYLGLYLALCWMFLGALPSSIIGAMLDVFLANIDSTILVANLGLIYGDMLFKKFFWRLFLALYGIFFGH